MLDVIEGVCTALIGIALIVNIFIDIPKLFYLIVLFVMVSACIVDLIIKLIKD